MRQFGLISPKIWHSQKWRELKSDSARLLYFYLHTNEACNSAGCYMLREPLALTELNWKVAKFRTAMSDLVRVGLIEWDRPEETVLITNFLRFSPPMNRNHMIGMLMHLKTASSQLLVAKRTREIRKLGIPFRNGIETVSKYQNQNQEKKERKKESYPQVVTASSPALRRARSPTAKAKRKSQASEPAASMNGLPPPSQAATSEYRPPVNAQNLSADELEAKEREAIAFIEQNMRSQHG